MSGFAPDWLRLREAVDHRSRNAELLAGLTRHFESRPEIRVVDLGAGLGSNLRGTYSALPLRQYWLLVDHDPQLLSTAIETIAKWADSARPTTSGLEAIKNDRSLHVELRRLDLAADRGGWSDPTPDLVTAAALFDLVSEEWIEKFVATLVRSKVVFYTVLTHDAATEWSPPHAADGAMRAAFESHFGRDKGFGPSVGGRATSLLADLLNRAGYEVVQARSPWRLSSRDRELIAALADGWAQAVRETGTLAESTIQEWTAARKAADSACTVGHEDLLAFPPR
jgi:hypothetical protein